MRWIVIAILAVIVPYTYVNIKFRKPNKPFEPYADMKAEAEVDRLLAAGYRRFSVRAEIPYPPLPATEITGGPAATPAATPGGLPPELVSVLIDARRLPTDYRELLAPAEPVSTAPFRLQFTARVESDREQLGKAEVFVRDGDVLIVPAFEPVPGELHARTKESLIVLTLPAGLLRPGKHTLTLVGAGSSLRWTVQSR
jgi:hypothetical protein